MKVIACVASPRGVRYVLMSGDRGDAKPVVLQHDTIQFGASEPRVDGLVQLRSRVKTLIENTSPDEVLVKPFEPQSLQPRLRRNITAAWFETAEVRGVVAEAARATATATSFRAGATVSRTVGARKKDEYVADDSYWEEEVDGALPKGFREVAIIAISRLRSAQ
jgi:hypothetical protein